MKNKSKRDRNNEWDFADKKHPHSYDWAALLILIGGVFLLFNFDILPVVYKPLIISWQMLLIVLGGISFVKRKYILGLVLTFIGVVFLWPVAVTIFPQLPLYDVNWQKIWPALLIGVGIIIIVCKKIDCGKQDSKEKRCMEDACCNDTVEGDYDKSQHIHKNIMFGGSKQIVLSQNFNGGEVNVMFGGVEIDLRKAKLAPEGAFLEINAAFGGCALFIPSDWKVQMSTHALMGGFEDKRVDIIDNDENVPILRIKASCIFGGGEIKH